MKKILRIIALVLIFNSCTNSKEEKRIHFEKIEVGKSLKIDYLNNHLEELEAKLVVAQKQYEKINEFSFGRSSSTKKKQLSYKTNELKRIEKLIEKSKKEISLSGLFNSFDFQDTPEGTVKHIFQAAQFSDYSKMRHLLDPYGEFNSTTAKLCLIEIEDKEYQDNWNRIFGLGRIMNKLRQTDNQADIEIAIGENSSQLVTVRLVKRIDKWYLIES